jgi:hypothetical protein
VLIWFGFEWSRTYALRRAHDAYLDSIRTRIADLEKRLTDRRKELREQVAAYMPPNPRPLPDLTADAVQILKPLPGVGWVTTTKGPALKGRLVHILDYHVVPAKDYTPDNDPEADALLYQEFLLNVQLVQAEQLAIFECLCQHHGLTDAWAEGFTADMIADYLGTILRFRQEDPGLKQFYTSATDGLGREDRWTLLQMGSPGQAFTMNILKAVLPLEDEATLDKSKSLAPVDLEARHKAQVGRVLGKAHFGFIVLGGSHDLTSQLPEGCEYVRVMVPAYQEAGRK